VQTFKDISTKLAEALPALKKRYSITYLALFGSVVRSDFNAQTSDVDILIDFDGEMGWEFFDLQKELKELLGHEVDLVCRQALKPHYWEVIKNELVHVGTAA
jgi:predicted nucleotidyltransferase